MNVLQNKPTSDKSKPRTPKEFYIKEKYETVEDSLKLFKDDELMFKPGESIYMNWCSIQAGLFLWIDVQTRQVSSYKFMFKSGEFFSFSTWNE